MQMLKQALLILGAISFVNAMPVLAAMDMSDLPSTKNRPMHEESAQQHVGPPPPEVENPSIPEGMTLEEVLERAGDPPPPDYPDPVPDDARYLFTFFEQLELEKSPGMIPEDLLAPRPAPGASPGAE